MSEPSRFLSPGQRFLPGILGGVGPLSHTLFEQHLLEAGFARGARSDQEHPVWLLVSASSTPNRMASLSGEGENAEPYLAHFARVLERAGADALFVVCNTAHAYHEPVQRQIGIPWVHLMRITVSHIRQTLGRVRRVGVLGTDGTLATRLYHIALEREGLIPVAPAVGSVPQQAVMRAIFDPEWGIKATGTAVSSRAVEALKQSADWCLSQGAEAVIAACTEVSVGLPESAYPAAPVIDPLRVAAGVAVDLAAGRIEPEDLRVG